MEQALAYVCCSAEESRVKVQKYCRQHDPGADHKNAGKARLSVHSTAGIKQDNP